MRRILVEHARRSHRVKRGDSAQRGSLEDAVVMGSERPMDLVALDDAVNELARFDPRKAQLRERYCTFLQNHRAASIVRRLLPKCEHAVLKRRAVSDRLAGSQIVPRTP